MAGEYYSQFGSAEMGEACSESSRVYVELGVGRDIGYTRQKAFHPGDQYIGIENGYAHKYVPELTVTPLNGFRRIRSVVESLFPDKPEMHFAVADGSCAPLQDGIADEFLIANVLSDPLLIPLVAAEAVDAAEVRLLRPALDEPPYTIDRDGVCYYLSTELGDERKALLQEAARVTRVGGRVIINSYITPDFVDHDEVAAWFQQQGFATDLLTPYDPAWDQKTFGYRETERRNRTMAHRFLIATKQVPSNTGTDLSS